jgi:hypothetical protein
MQRRRFLKTGMASTLALAHTARARPVAAQAARPPAARTLDSGITARFADLTYSGSTAPALVVELGLPWRFVSWAEAQFVPFWDIEGVWVTTEWFETLGSKSVYDFEPISDKQLRYTHVSLTEAGPARAVVNWRYALCDARPEAEIFHDNTTAEETHTIYPDGVTVRKLVGYPGNGEPREGQPRMWEVAELLFFIPKGSQVKNVVGDEGVLISNIAGDSYRHRFKSLEIVTIDFQNLNLTDIMRRLCQVHPSSRDWTEFIWQGGFHNRPEPFVVFPNSQELFPHLRCPVCGGDHPETSLWQVLSIWKHYPQGHEEYHIGIPATEADLKTRAVSASYLSIHPWLFPEEKLKANPDLPFDPHWSPPRGTTWLMLQGINPGDANYPRRLAASWLHPAEIQTSVGRYLGYDPSQRAYRFDTAEGKIDFRLSPASGFAQINPVVIVENWTHGNPKIRVDARELSDKNVAVTWVGSRLIVWFRREVLQPVRIQLQGWPGMS